MVEYGQRSLIRLYKPLIGVTDEQKRGPVDWLVIPAWILCKGLPGPANGLTDSMALSERLIEVLEKDRARFVEGLPQCRNDRPGSIAQAGLPQAGQFLTWLTWGHAGHTTAE